MSLSCLDREPQLVTSSSDGNLNVYEFGQGVFFLSRTISLEKLYLSHAAKNLLEFSGDASMLCIGIQIFSIGTTSSLSLDKTATNRSCQTMIVCATTNAIYFIDVNTGDLLNLIDFKSVQLNTKYLNISCLIPQAVDFCMVENKQINAALLFLFQNEMDILKCADITSTVKNISKANNDLSDKDKEPVLTVFPR